MNIDYNKVQLYIESNASSMQKNDLTALFNAVPTKDRAMLVAFFVTELKVNVLEYMTTIPDMLFANLAGILPNTVVIPETVTAVGAGAFFGCKDVQAVQIKGKIKSIEPGTFAESNLVQIQIPEGVQYIKEDAFRDCSNLSKVQLPQSIAKVHKTAFEDCNPGVMIGIPKAKRNPNVLQGFKFVEDPNTGKKVPDRNDPLTAFYASTLKGY